MNTKLLIIIIILCISYFNCSSNREVVFDNRKYIINAEVWKQEYIYNDSTSGMRLEFVTPTRKSSKGLYWQPTPQRRHKPEYVNISLWKYPLDTVIQKELTKNYMFSLPSTEAVDLITINYRIKNDPIEIYSKTDTSNFLFFQIPTGKYLITCSPSDYESKWMKDINIKSNYWSVVKIDTIPAVVVQY